MIFKDKIILIIHYKNILIIYKYICRTFKLNAKAKG